MTIANISNGESLLSVRGKLNTAIDKINEKAPLPVSPNLTAGDLANFSLYKDRDIATNQDDADTMSADLSAMAGYAANASTTGGGSGTIYFVTDPSDSTFSYADGSFRWAVEQVRSAGSGRVVFDPENSFDIVLQSQIETPPNITIDAPGRNVTIWRPDDVTGIKVSDDNCVIRRLSFKTLTSAGGSVRDSIWIEPTLCDKVWIDECTFGESADGCIDMVSLSDLTATCRVTVSNCIFRGHDKVMLIGSLACYNDPPPAYCPTATAETPQLLVTLYKNVFDHVAQRNPKVVTKAFVHSINNYFRIKQIWQPSESSYGAAYGALAATGGQVFSEANLYSAAVGSGFSAVDAVTTAQVPSGGGAGATDGPGYSKDSGSVVDNSMTITEVSAGSVTTPPYTITPISITNTGVGRAAFAETIYSGAGAYLNAGPDGLFSWHPDNTQDPDGWMSISLNASISGRFIRVDKRASAPSPFPWQALRYGPALTVGGYTLFELAESNNTTSIFQLATPRVSTLTIASGVITAIGGYHTISSESGTADDLDTINFTDTPADGQRIRIRPTSASETITVKHNTGNILLPGGTDIALDGAYAESLVLVWDAALSKLIIESV
jgi:pectate lyase